MPATGNEGPLSLGRGAGDVLNNRTFLQSFVRKEKTVLVLIMAGKFLGWFPPQYRVLRDLDHMTAVPLPALTCWTLGLLERGQPCLLKS